MENEIKDVSVVKTREIKNNNRNKKEKKNNETPHLTYTLGDKLDKLFPQYKPSKKKEDNKK